GVHVDQQEGDAFLRLDLGIGAHQAEHHVGVLAQRGPGLLPIDDVVVAFAHRTGLQRSQVGAGAWLGVALTPPVLAVKDARQVVAFLLLAAEPDDDRRHHRYAKRNDAWRTGGGRLFIEDVPLDRAPAGAAVLHRPVLCQPALFAQDLVPANVIVPGKALVALNLGGDIGRQLLAQKLPHFFPKGLLFGAVVQFHLSTLSLPLRSDHFEQTGSALAAADAHGDHHVLGAATLAFNQGVAGQPRASHAVWMADGDGTRSEE